MFIQQNNQRYSDNHMIDALCLPLGIEWGEWDLSMLTDDILASLQVPLNVVKQKNDYLTEDIVSLSPQTPNLETILAKFDKPHHHVDDEVRLVLSGSGIFGVIPPEGEPFEIHVHKGDFIVIPAYTCHWFMLTDEGHITALRIFKTQAGWEAIYEPQPEALSAAV